MYRSCVERARAKWAKRALGPALLAVAVIASTAGAAFATAPPAPRTPPAPPARPRAGQVPDRYWLVDTAGRVWPFGGAENFGGVPPGAGLASPVVAVSATPDGGGYWLAAADGTVFAEGGARLYGPAAAGLNTPVVGIAPTPDGLGYWLVSADGAVYSFGDARYFGSLKTGPSGPAVVRLVPTPDGAGYWLLDAGGGVYSFGDARSFGSELVPSPGRPSPGRAFVDMAPTPDGLGYWLLDAAGTVYSFGDARDAGSAPVPTGGDPAENIVPGPGGAGYWVVDQNGAATPLGGAGGGPAAQALLFSPDTAGDRAVLFALSQLGKPYLWGGTGPRGYDCSGLAYRSWYEATGTYIPRIAAAQFHGAGPAVPWQDLQAGDLVFWGSNRAKWQSVYHTAIYVGGGEVVEAVEKTVQLSTMYQWGGRDLMSHGVRPS
jgi:hypothetical protein